MITIGLSNLTAFKYWSNSHHSTAIYSSIYISFEYVTGVNTVQDGPQYFYTNNHSKMFSLSPLLIQLERNTIRSSHKILDLVLTATKWLIV